MSGPCGAEPTPAAPASPAARGTFDIRELSAADVTELMYTVAGTLGSSAATLRSTIRRFDTAVPEQRRAAEQGADPTELAGRLHAEVASYTAALHTLGRVRQTSLSDFLT
jgi:hypothetical protein